MHFERSFKFVFDEKKLILGFQAFRLSGFQADRIKEFFLRLSIGED